MQIGNTQVGGRCLVLLLLGCAGIQRGYAEEGGSGHYTPGALSSFIDGVAPEETLLVRYDLVNYDGGMGAQGRLPFGGSIAADANVSAWANSLSLFWRPPVDIGEGGRWSYAMSATLPYVSLDVTATVATRLPGGEPGPSLRRRDRATGLGDMAIAPVMLNYTVTPDLSLSGRLTAYVPTGRYEVGALANTGKNYWSYEPTLALMYFGQQNGIEASWFAGITFNETNDATRYRSGDQFHSELTVAQHLPLAQGLAGVGVTGYYYKQVSADTGSGARLGAFKAMASGVGPTFSYVAKVGGHDVIAELKWLRELHARNRPEGDTVFLKLVYTFVP